MNDKVKGLDRRKFLEGSLAMVAGAGLSAGSESKDDSSPKRGYRGRMLTQSQPSDILIRNGFEPTPTSALADRCYSLQRQFVAAGSVFQDNSGLPQPTVSPGHPSAAQSRHQSQRPLPRLSVGCHRRRPLPMRRQNCPQKRCVLPPRPQVPPAGD